jgi:hypothetical protein
MVLIQLEITLRQSCKNKKMCCYYQNDLEPRNNQHWAD